MKARILIVDDESCVRESLRQLLSRDFFVCTAVSGKEATTLCQKDDFDLIILDILLPDCNGVDLLGSLRAEFPEVPVVMITGTRQIKTAVCAMKLGAFDYITKPFVPSELIFIVKRALQIKDQQHETVKWFKRAQEEIFFGNIVGRSPKMIEVFKRIAQVMYTSTTVLIEGETGTGKELIAKAIHFQGTRRNELFVPVHIASLSELLLESELFGHEKGAFTDAVRTKKGTLELADKGTLFLDEVGDIPYSVQVKLLRILQEREFRRVGGTKDIKVDIRLIAATNKCLWDEVEKGAFREDLYYRVNVVSIKVPPLRERVSDIPVLAYHFLEKSRKKMSNKPAHQNIWSGGKVRGFTKDSIELLKSYNWPGNIRELDNLIEQLVLMVDNNWITPKDLPVYIQKGTPPKDSLDKSVSSYEKKLIEDALIKTNGVISRTANLLGTTRRILKYRMDRLNIAPRQKDNFL